MEIIIEITFYILAVHIYVYFDFQMKSYGKI